MKRLWLLIHRIIAFILRRNLKSAPKELIIDQMNESRPLPLGVKEFNAWAERIIAGACIPGGEDDPAKFIESQKFSLADMIMHLGPTESHKPDAFFIHSLRKAAINQIAFAMMKEIKEKHAAAKARIAADEAPKADSQASNEANQG